MIANLSNPQYRMMVGIACIVCIVGVAGCSSQPQLMPTPTLYARDGRDLFPDVPAELNNNKVEVLYLADRTPDTDDAGESLVRPIDPRR